MNEETTGEAGANYTAKELAARRRGFLIATVGALAALASTLLIPPSLQRYAFIAVGSLATLATLQVWPWVTGEVRSRTFSKGADQW